MRLHIETPAFAPKQRIPDQFTRQGGNVSPRIEWSGAPADTRSFALVVEDPDAPSPEPFCHWLVWGLAPQKGQLLEGETPPRVGKNSFGNSEWLLPDPPTGHGAHDYVFQLFALDQALTLMSGASRSDVLGAMKGHVIAAAVLTATYLRSDEEDWEDDGG